MELALNHIDKLYLACNPIPDFYDLGAKDYRPPSYSFERILELKPYLLWHIKKEQTNKNFISLKMLYNIFGINSMVFYDFLRTYPHHILSEVSFSYFVPNSFTPKHTTLHCIEFTGEDKNDQLVPKKRKSEVTFKICGDSCPLSHLRSEASDCRCLREIAKGQHPQK